MPSVFEDAAVHHPKASKAGNEAAAFWHWAIMWSNANGTNGYLDEAILFRIPPVPILPKKAKQLAERCVDASIKPGGAGLFERADGGGYWIHDFDKYYAPPREPTAEELELEAKRRADKAAAGRLGGMKSGEVRRGGRGKQGASNSKHSASENEADCFPYEAESKQPASANEAECLPVASPGASGCFDASEGGIQGGSLGLFQEEPGEREQLRGEGREKISGSKQDLPVTARRARKRRAALPDGWRPTAGSFAAAARDAGLTEAQALGQLAQFRDYHLREGSLMADWDAAFRTWIRNTRRFGRGAINPPAPTGGGWTIQPDEPLDEEDADAHG